MIKLQIPLQSVDERTIYQECADNFRDKAALGYLDDVVDSSDAYKKCIPKHVDCIPKPFIKEGDKNKIIDVYSKKFVPKESVGRKYYEAIMANANGRCPICGCGKLKTLDHFLPKSIYPLLCVTPANLVPTCRDCNMDKRVAFDPQYYSLPFNPYFDDMTDIWLKCEICFEDDNTFVVSFANGYDKHANLDMWQKYETHLQIYDLANTFQAKALEEIDNCKRQDQKLFRLCGEANLMKELIERKESSESNDVNSWRSALYRELIVKCNDYCKWLDNDKG